LLQFTDHFGISKEEIRKILSKALSKGGTYSDLFFEHIEKNYISMEEGIVKEATKSVFHGVGIRVLKGESTGYAYTEEPTMKKMEEAALIAAAIANSAKEVDPLKLSEETFTNRYPIMEVISSASLSDKIKWVEEAEDSATSSSPDIKKVNVVLRDYLSTVQIATSEGKLLKDNRPMLMFSVHAIAERKGIRQIGISSGGGRIGKEYFQEKLSPADHGRKAARQALLLLDAVDAPAGPMELILAPAESGILLHESIGHPLEADFIRKGTSAYTGRLGDRVASELVTVIDDGTVKNDRGSINFDDEGTSTRANVLIENGILKGFMNDIVSAKHLEVEPTGNGRRQSYRYPPQPRMTVTYLANGSSDPEEIFESTRKGIYCKSFKGGQVDISNGDFVFVPVEAYLVENGRISAPVKNLTIIGNGPDALSKVTMVGNDFEFSDGRWTCGKGQNVPVGVGLPTLKISEITVGGSTLQG
jgi:TldD protein